LRMNRFICVCGARPNFMKIAPIVARLDRCADVETLLVHTGQHYDERLSRLFFDELQIRRPDVNLDVGSGSHAVQTAAVMTRFEPLVNEFHADAVIVVGDVNSTLACALVSAKFNVPVAHVESGLRSFDRTMPEEVNRVLTDAISDLCFVSEPTGVENLRREGIGEDKIHFVGNVMVDTLLQHREQAARADVLKRLELQPRGFALVTLHRPANVDDPVILSELVDALIALGQRTTIVFPMHPRTRARLESFDLLDRLQPAGGVLITEPLGYLDFLCLMDRAAAVITDSGERPVTITQGTNQLVAPQARAIIAALETVLANPPRSSVVPELWDGCAAQRIVAILTKSASVQPTGTGTVGCES